MSMSVIVGPMNVMARLHAPIMQEVILVAATQVTVEMDTLVQVILIVFLKVNLS